jgi:hypothetical protein
MLTNERDNCIFWFIRDSSSTLYFILGSTFGEAVIPVCIGFIMRYVSPNGMNVCVLVSVLLLIVIYLTADWMMKAHSGDNASVRVSSACSASASVGFTATVTATSSGSGSASVNGVNPTHQQQEQQQEEEMVIDMEEEERVVQVTSMLHIQEEEEDSLW